MRFFLFQFAILEPMSIKSYIPAFIVLVLIGLLHNVGGLYFDAYEKYWWWDVLLHFLGGLWVGLSGFWFIYKSHFLPVPRKTTVNFFMVILLPVLLVGIGWEIFEYMFGLTFVLPGESYRIDTISDIGMDIVGSLIVYLYYRLKMWRDFM